MLFKKSNAVSVGNSSNWKITKDLLDLVTRDNNHLDTTKIIKLIGKGANIYCYPVTNQTISHPLFAHKCFNLDILNAVLKKEKNLNIYQTDNYGQSALTYYLAFNPNCNGEIIKRLVDNKTILVNEQTCRSLTPLQFYLKNANEIKAGVVEVFLNAEDINIQIKDESDNSLLHYLCNAESVSLELLQLFIGKGLKLNEKNKDGQTILHILYPGAYYGESTNLNKLLDLLPFLISKGIDVNIYDNCRNTVLHGLCELFSAKRIQNKADHAIFNSVGVTPLQRLFFDGVISSRPAPEKQDAVDQLITRIIVEVIRNSNKHTLSLDIFLGKQYFENILLALQRPTLFKKFGKKYDFENYMHRVPSGARSRAYTTFCCIKLWERNNKKILQKALQYQIVEQAFALQSIILKNDKGEELATVNINPRRVTLCSEQEKHEQLESSFSML